MNETRHPGEGRDLGTRGHGISPRGPGLRRGDENGFTLVELMVVIVILGLLATIVVINVMPAMDRAAATTARANIAQIEEGLKLYKLANGRYPTAEEGLAALTPGTVDRLPNDPWGRPYRYAVPGQSGKPFTVATWGADGREGGSGEDQDLSN